MRRKLLKNCHVYSMLLQSARKKHLSFHTPGHKKGKWDLTELSYTDNLACPQGCIQKAEQDVAAILGAKKSFLLTDGSTCGVLAMLYAAKKLGARTVAFQSDAHKSVWKGCAALGLTPLVFSGKVVEKISTPPTFHELLAEFDEGLKRADALLLTSPNYYGKTVDLAPFRAYCEGEGKLLLVDGAHGGHLHYKPCHAGKYADMWVDGVHKSLPALTQGAVVSARTERMAEALFEGVDVFRTTSPSYPIMASVEYAIKYPENTRLEALVRAFAKDCPRAVVNEDWTKLCVRFGKNASAAHADLEKRGIYAEFFDGEVVEFYLSPATKIRHFYRLKRELTSLLARYPYEEDFSIQRNPAPLVCIANEEIERVNLDEAEGRICAAACGLFPPCSPLILAGERIQKEQIAQLNKATNVFGLIDKKILVVKE